MGAIIKLDFQFQTGKRIFFKRQLSKPRKKSTIFTFFLQQGETRTSSEPIYTPLRLQDCHQVVLRVQTVSKQTCKIGHV